MKYLALSAVVATTLLTACGEKNTTTNEQPAKQEATPSEQTIRIATETSFKPFSYLDTSGQPIGFEIDLANALCQKMQAKCEILPQDWDSLIPGLNANKFDAIMAGMSATDERRQVVDFSEPYFNNTLVLVAKKDANVGINDVNGKNVATQQATVSADYLKANYPQAIVKTYDKQDNAYLDLAAGRVDFMLSDIVPMLDWLKTDQGGAFEVKGAPIDINDKVAIAVRKNDAIKAKFDTALNELKASGEYDAIVAKYFDSSVINATTTQAAVQSAPQAAAPQAEAAAASTQEPSTQDGAQAATDTAKAQ